MAAMAVLAAAGCGSQAHLQSSNRGAGSRTADTTVENAYIVPHYAPGSCAVQTGDTADLRFTVTNSRDGQAEQLLDVTTPAVDQVKVTPPLPLDIPPKATVAAGEPNASGSKISVSMNGLKQSVRPGAPVDVTFRFKQFGNLTMPVSVEACPTER